VGCGDGEFLRLLPTHNRTVGLDFSHAALARATGSRVLGSVDRLPFEDCSFDLVTCFEVLEHLPDTSFDLALTELQRVSRRYILVSVPNSEPLGESLVWCPRCSCAFHSSHHVRSFDERALQELLPHARMIACKPCGPTVCYGDSKFARLAVMIARCRPSALTSCPQCGYAQGAASAPAAQLRRSQSLIPGGARHVPKIAIRILRRMIFRRSRPYWLLALYGRD
jgi:hypothetical protein